jgi:EAL domain-containing protein (putative c-di-GMP-specific phosphodiesterase class I)
MYRAKERGRARYEFADPPGAAVVATGTTLAAEAYATPAPDDEPTHYEPAVDLGTGAVRAVEALVPTAATGPERRHGKDAAYRVRAAAEHAQGVLEHACRRAVAWQERFGDAAPALWVDVPVRELGRGAVVGRVAAALQASGLPPHRLSLEVPERHLVGFGPSARADLVALGDLGVRLAVDDARGGIVTWPHLDRIPVHAVKLGASLVAGLGRHRADGALARSMVALAHAMEMRVVATGVVTGGQREELGVLGCDLVQGGAVHGRVPATDVERLLAPV